IRDKLVTGVQTCALPILKRFESVKGFCRYVREATASSRTFIASEEDERGTEESAKFGENRNDQCEGSDGLPECRRTGPPGKRSQIGRASCREREEKAEEA